MSKGTAMYHIWSLAAQSLKHGGTDDLMLNIPYVHKANLDGVETVGGLLDALEQVTPKWKK